MSHLVFLTKIVGRNQNQGELSVREKCFLAGLALPILKVETFKICQGVKILGLRLIEIR